MNSASETFKNGLLAQIPTLRAFAISLCGNVDRADDLVQEALVKAWSNSGSFVAGTNFRAWLFTILRNTYFSEFRKKRWETEDADGEHAAMLSVPPNQEHHVELTEFKRALLQLPDDQREAILLVGAAGFSYEEAAEIGGCAVGTVKSRVNRARAKLSALMGLNEGVENPSVVDTLVASRAAVG